MVSSAYLSTGHIFSNSLRKYCSYMSLHLRTASAVVSLWSKSEVSATQGLMSLMRVKTSRCPVVIGTADGLQSTGCWLSPAVPVIATQVISSIVSSEVGDGVFHAVLVLGCFLSFSGIFRFS